MTLPTIAWQLHEIENENGNSNDNRLRCLQPIDTSKDVDGIRTKYCKHSHVDVVKDACKINNKMSLFGKLK